MMVLIILASLEDSEMSVVTPRPPRSDHHPDAEALEALIKEARRRARRRRFAVCALAAAAAGLLGFYGFNHGGGATRPSDQAQQPNGEAGVALEVGYGRWRSAPGLEGGAITALALDPEHPNTVFAATLEAGVFKSSDGGSSWQALDIAPNADRVDALAIAPQDPRTVYVGTGGGNFKSTDGGATWQAVNSGLFGHETAAARDHRLLEGFVYVLAVDPTNLEVVYAATWERGLLKSTNGGASWQSTGFNGPVDALALDPTDPATVYVSGSRTLAGVESGGVGSGVFRSSDGGASWQPVALEGTFVYALALDPQHPDTVYAGTRGKGVFKSTDGGASWRAAGLEGKNIRGLILNPKNPENVYAESEGEIFVSTEGGGTWRALNGGWVRGTWPTALALNPRNPATIYLGTITAVDGKGDVGAGVFKSVDGGDSWRSMNAGLTDARVSALALDPRRPGTAYAGIDGRGVFKRIDGRWRPADSGLTSAGVHAFAVDPENPSTVYAGADGGVFKSTNAAARWYKLKGPLSGIGVSALAVDPQTPRIVYAIASEDGVFRSNDAGATWQRLAGGFGTDSDTGALALNPTNPDTLYLGGVGLFKSNDSGTTWRSAGLTGSIVYELALDPKEPATIYAGTDGGLFKSTDGGAHWRSLGDALDGIRVETLAIDRQHRNTLYAGTDREVLKSADGGQTWRRFDHLPLRSFDALAVDSRAGLLYAGAWGGGIFELSLAR
jgi:photosystem II stability/assembly factor-like uncharacterized protein